MPLLLLRPVVRTLHQTSPCWLLQLAVCRKFDVMVTLDERNLESAPGVAGLEVVVEEVAKKQRVIRTLGSIGSNVNIRSSRPHWRGEHELRDETGSRRLKVVPWFAAVAETGFCERGNDAFLFDSGNANLDVNHVFGE